MNESNENLFLELPIIPLRGIVVFPKMVLHFDVGRKKSIKALQKAMDDDQKVFLVCQKDASVDEPNINDMYDVGVICTIRQMMRIPGSENMRVVVEGDERATLYSFTSVKPYIGGLVEIAGDNNSNLEISEDEDKAYQRIIKRICDDILNDLYTNSYKSLKMYNHAVHDEKIEYFHIRSFFL